MTGVATEESGAGRSFEGASSGQLQLQCQSGETSEEWRSLEQVENGIPSTSPAYWYIDDDDDGGQKPFELYGKHTWKIDKFSQITKRELRSNAFEVGGYKWYVLIYPQGCDVCNHLSLFLCVANHDKLLPGWSHLAQFTIAVVNKDPKKSKYSDTLHRFWKKEHDWGWKKFMELPKVFEGFIDADTLIIKAQVQIIRERTDRPFRCLDCPYRRELVRVYLTNVDGLCRRFLEDQRAKLRKLIEDKARWSSFCTFWLGMDQSARQFMSRENAESILKVVVKHFFVEKEVTSTLVMDSLYIGMKALNSQNKGKKSKGKNLEAEPVPIIHIDEDTFVLVDDVLLLLERAAMEPLPPIDEKGPQTRTKDVAAGEELNKDSIERDERRLAELGRRTIEIFVLAHIFSSKIEVAYQEAVSLMRQEELIREEEAAWLANGEQKTRRRVADKEKKSKKKQSKHKKNNRKLKDKGRDETLGSDVVLNKTEVDSPTIERDEFSDVETEMPHEKPEVAENISDLSDSIDCEPEILPLDSKGRDASPVNWGTDTSKPHHPIQACSNEISAVSGVVNGVEGIGLSALDDSSSTCSSNLVPPVVISVPQRANLRHHHNNQTTSSRGRTRQSACTSKIASQPSEAVPDVGHSTDSSRSSKAVEILLQDGFSTLQDIVINRTKHHVEKDGGTGYMHRVSCSKDVNIGTSVTSPARIPSKNIIPSMAPLKLDAKVNSASDPVLFKNSSTNGPKQIGSSRDVVLSGASGTSVKSPTRIPSKIILSNAPSKLESNINAAGNPVIVKNSSTNGPKQTDRSNPNENGAASKPETRHVSVTTDKPSLPSLPVVSRPLSAPLGLTSRPAAVSTVSSVGQTAPTLARSVSSTGRLSPEQPTPSYVPQSYHNANMGSHGSSSAYPQIPQNHSANTGLNLSFPFSNALAPVFSPQNVDRMDLIHPNVSYGMVNQTNLLQSGPRIWTEQHNNDMQHFNSYTPMHIRPETHLPSQVLPSSSGHQSNVTGDEFPHLDIINDLLDDDLLIGNEPMLNSGFQNFNNGPQHMNRLFSFPDESGFSRDLVYSTSSCGFEGTRMYHDNGFQNGYNSSTTLYDTVHRASSRPYINGQIDGLVPSQWQRAGLELLYPENDGYSYQHVMEYPNLNVCVNGYSVYRPSNGL